MAGKVKVSPIQQAQGKQVKKNWILWIGGGIIIALSLLNLGLWARNEIVKWQRAPTEQEIAKWEEVVQKTPTYRDGYLKLATLYWKLKEDQKAKEMLDKAVELDPNYEGTRELKRALGY